MILDSTLLLADGQSGTTSAASTDYIDTVAVSLSDAYVGCWFVVRVGTAFTAGAGAPTATFQIQTDDDTEFQSNSVTLAQSSALLAADLTANTIVWKVRIPPTMKRYVRGYKVVDDGTDSKRFSAGTWDMFIVKDADLNFIGN